MIRCPLCNESTHSGRSGNILQSSINCLRFSCNCNCRLLALIGELPLAKNTRPSVPMSTADKTVLPVSVNPYPITEIKKIIHST